MLIKICGVRTAEIALFAAQSGADFIGMILTPGFRRSVPLPIAKEIAAAAIDGGAKPVAVFVSETKDLIEDMCAKMQVVMVQSYLPQELDPRLDRFYINQGPLRSGRDFLLMESAHPGSGQSIDEAAFIRPESDPFFLAGGLNPSNVASRIARHCPSGVDVSSGVEQEGGKDKQLILKFIQEARRGQSHG